MKKGKERGNPSGRPPEKDLTPDEQERADRARSIREAAGFESQARFARHLGISPSRWNNYERGHPIGRAYQAILIRKIEGLTRDYIEDGRIDGLPIALARRLGELPEATDPSPAPAGRSIPRPSRR